MRKYLSTIALLFILAVPALAQQPCPAPPNVLHWRNQITPTEIREYLSHSKSLREWNRNVAVITGLNSGRLPSFWDKEIIRNGFFRDLAISWGQGLAQLP